MQHPDWAIHIDGRAATQSRCQYVLDLSRKEVRDYVYDQVSAILHSANIRYVKWDMNRQLSDLGSSYLSADHKEELFHRYVLGVYELQERLVTEFPNMLLENCSGGGARFDPGMLYYSPQIWSQMIQMQLSVSYSGGNFTDLSALLNGCTCKRLPEPYSRKSYPI